MHDHDHGCMPTVAHNSVRFRAAHPQSTLVRCLERGATMDGAIQHSPHGKVRGAGLPSSSRSGATAWRCLSWRQMFQWESAGTSEHTAWTATTLKAGHDPAKPWYSTTSCPCCAAGCGTAST